MDLRHLRYFVAVAEELHFGRAAERVGIEQSPLSRAIQSLERDLGVRLLARTSRSTRMTAAGEVFLEDARRILGEVAKARASAHAAARGGKSRLRIGMSRSIAEPRLSRLLAQTKREERDLDIRVFELTVAEQLRDLRAGALDLGIGPQVSGSADIQDAALWSAPCVALLPAEHPLVEKSAVTLVELLHQRCVACHPELIPALEHLADSRVAGPHAAASLTPVGDLSILMMMVAAGIAVAIVMASQVRTLPPSEVVHRPFEGSGLAVRTHAMWRPGPSTELVQRFMARARTVA